jgi:FdhE protein
MAVADERSSLLDRHLAALRQARNAPDPALDLAERLLRESALSARSAAAVPFALPREHAAARLRQGIPLLHDQPAELDVQFAADLFRRLLGVLASDGHADPLHRARLDALAAAATSGQLEPQRLFNEAFVNHADHVADLALEHGLDPRLLATLAAWAVAPLLRAYAERLRPTNERIEADPAADAVWRAGYCPVCGGWPLLAEVRGVGFDSLLRCGACGSGWPLPLQVCPYCANADADADELHQIAGADERGFRIWACDRCLGYLKLHTVGDPSPAELLVLDDAASEQLDRLALDRGYRRPAGSGFRIELAVPEEDWLDELGEA